MTANAPWRLATLVALLCLARRADAQVDPSGPWRTLHTPHFRVHFRPVDREPAQRTAREAERARAGLLPERVSAQLGGGGARGLLRVAVHRGRPPARWLPHADARGRPDGRTLALAMERGVLHPLARRHGAVRLRQPVLRAARG